MKTIYVGYDAWLERPYQELHEDDAFYEQACEEFWDDEAAKFVAENWNDILDMPQWQDLLTRVGKLAHNTRSDEIARSWGQELESIVRKFCLLHEDAINARCCDRADRQHQELLDDMRAAGADE